MLAGIKAVIVDLDGTMVDTLGDFVVALNHTLEDIGLPPVDRLMVERSVGKGSEHLVRTVLDHQLATHWITLPSDTPDPLRYVQSWRLTDAKEQRTRQLAVVQHMGDELQKLTRNTSLRLGLRIMRRPAQLAGLSALQGFLESGFDAFATMQDPTEFMKAIREREQHWINALFDSPQATVVTELSTELHRT